MKKTEFAEFFNKQHKDMSFYAFDNSEKKAHKRAVSFLAFEYEDNTGSKRIDIRHWKKTVTVFKKYQLEEELSDKVTEYLKDENLKNS